MSNQAYTIDTQVLFINADNLIRWDKAKNKRTDEYINSGSGSWVLKDSDDDETEIATGTMTYMTGTNGRWHGIIDKDDVLPADISLGRTYYIEITLTGPSDEDGFKRIECIAAYDD
jgi:hypothetical protein